MFKKCHVRPAFCLTRPGDQSQNSLTRRIHSGKPRGLDPTHSAIAPDLAGIARRPRVPGPCTPSHAAAWPRPVGFAVTCSQPEHVEANMAKASFGKAARHPARDAQAPRPGAAQPPLDLSLGHIGTIGEGTDPDIEVEDIGPFRVVFDHASMTGKVFTDTSAFANRAERRAAEKQFRRAVGRANGETGFAIRKGGTP
jgi:hypothetical protein